MAQIGSLSVKLGLVTVEWDKSTAAAKKSAKDLQSQFDQLGTRVKGLAEDFKNWGIASATLGMGLLYHEAVQLSDEVSDLSKSFGLSIPEVLSFRDALQSSGGKAENADKAINTLFGHIAEAKEGNDAAIAQFEKLGISFDELKTMSPYEAIQKVAAGFSNVADQFERTKAVKELFGKAGIGLSMEDLAANMEGGSKKNQQYADSLKKVGEVSDAMKANLQNLTVAFADLIAPLTSSGIISVDTFSKALKGLTAAAIPLAIGAIATSLLSVGIAFQKIVIEIRAATAAGALFNLTAGGASPLGLIIKAVTTAAAIGTFLYINSSASAAPPQEGRTATGTVGQGPIGNSMNPDERGSWDSAAQQAESKKAKQKQAEIQLAKDLSALEHSTAIFNLNAIGKKTELQIKLNEIDAQASREKLTITAKEKTELEDITLSEKSRAGIIELANQQRNKANQQALDAKALATAQYNYEIKIQQDAFAQEKIVTRQILEIDKQKVALEIEQTKYQTLQNELDLIELDRSSAQAQILAKQKEELIGVVDAKKQQLIIDKAGLEGEKVDADAANKKLVALDKEAQRRKQLANDAAEAELELQRIDFETQAEIAQLLADEATKRYAYADERQRLAEESAAAEIEGERILGEAVQFWADSENKLIEEKIQRDKIAFDYQLQNYELNKQISEEAWSYVDARNAAILTFQNEGEETLRQQQLSNVRLALEKDLLNVSQKERDTALAQYDLEMQIYEFKRKGEKLGMSPESMDAVAESMQRVGDSTIKLQDDIKATQETFKYGWETAYRKYEEDANNAGLQGAQTFQVFSNQVGSSIDELVDKGETSFEKLTMSIIKDLEKIYLKQQLMSIVSESTSWAKTGISALRSYFGGVGGAPSMESGTSTAWMGHATGGNVSANSPSIVGERGPELFMPKQSGMIIPNNAIGDSMGNQPANVYNGPYIANMSAIDTQSGLQFLAKNKQGVWAANQSVNRSIPMSR